MSLSVQGKSSDPTWYFFFLQGLEIFFYKEVPRPSRERKKGETFSPMLDTRSWIAPKAWSLDFHNLDFFQHSSAHFLRDLRLLGSWSRVPPVEHVGKNSLACFYIRDIRFSTSFLGLNFFYRFWNPKKWLFLDSQISNSADIMGNPKSKESPYCPN